MKSILPLLLTLTLGLSCCSRIERFSPEVQARYVQCLREAATLRLELTSAPGGYTESFKKQNPHHESYESVYISLRREEQEEIRRILSSARGFIVSAKDGYLAPSFSFHLNVNSLDAQGKKLDYYDAFGIQTEAYDTPFGGIFYVVTAKDKKRFEEIVYTAVNEKKVMKDVLEPSSP